MELTFDSRDAEIVAECMAALDQRPEPRVGDFLLYSDGTIARIADATFDDIVQPASGKDRDRPPWPGSPCIYRSIASTGGSYHLGHGYVSYSGSLQRGIPVAALTLTDEKRDGAVWIFHHGWRGANRGVHTRVPFRVYAVDPSIDARS